MSQLNLYEKCNQPGRSINKKNQIHRTTVDEEQGAIQPKVSDETRFVHYHDVGHCNGINDHCYHDYDFFYFRYVMLAYNLFQTIFNSWIFYKVGFPPSFYISEHPPTWLQIFLESLKNEVLCLV